MQVCQDIPDDEDQKALDDRSARKAKEQVGNDARRPRARIVARRNVHRHIVADIVRAVVARHHRGHDEDEGGEEEVGSGIVGKGSWHHHHECRQHSDCGQGTASLGHPAACVVVGTEHCFWKEGIAGKEGGRKAGSFCGGSDRFGISTPHQSAKK